MGCPDGSNGRGASLCLRGRNDPPSSGMAVERDEHGKRGGFYDHRTGHKDHEPGRFEDRDGMEEVSSLYPVRDDIFTVVGDPREHGGVTAQKQGNALHS